MREVSLSMRLRRAGFTDTARASALLDDPALSGLNALSLIEDFAACPDPDQGLLALIRLAETCGGEASDFSTLAAVFADSEARRRLLAVLGASSALGNHLCAHPEHLTLFLDNPETDQTDTAIPPTSWQAEREGFLGAVRADSSLAAPVAGCEWAEGVAALRSHYYARVTSLAAADLTSPNPLEAVSAVSRTLSDIVAGALEAGLALARHEIPEASAVDLAVIAMGKTGACEVNYVSDVDVIYVAAPASRRESEGVLLDEAEAIAVATKMATLLAKAVSAPASEPALWVLDANLRPEGQDGPLVRTLASHLEYYRRWAKGWEFQALLKARAIAGAMELGRAYVEATREFVWNAASSDNFVQDSRAMRRRVEATIASKDEARHLKLGKGGLRDVEFTVQLLQLVHGRTDENLHVRPTLDALVALSEGGYISRSDGERLNHDYRVLRLLEHRIQLQRLKRSHLVPSSEVELRRVARAMGMPEISDASKLEALWQETRREVRSLHQEIYYRPLLPLAARLSTDDIALNDDAAKERLAAIGYRDPGGALRHIGVLTDGVSRAAAISRQLLPVMLGWFAEAPHPDAGLLAFRILFEKAGTNSYFMRTLRDGGAAAERLCHVLGSSKFVAQQLPELPESVSWLADLSQLAAPSREELESEMESLVGRRVNASDIAQAGRYLRRREMLRAGLAQALGASDGEQTRRAVSLAADIAVHAALRGALTHVCAGKEPLSDFLVVALGRMGGQEMCFASDADLMVVYEPFDGAHVDEAGAEAVEVAAALMRLLGEIGSEPPLPADFDLRPEGKDGPVARSLDSYAEYYERWAATWERQALLRARPCAGAVELGERFVALIDRFRYPKDGLSASEAKEIRLMKARVENERIPRGVRPERHLKLGRGGQLDVEWTVQLLQLSHAGALEPLRVTGTLAALRAARDCGLLNGQDAAILQEAWALASELRDLNFLATGRANAKVVDQLPTSFEVLAQVAFLAGDTQGERSQIEEQYLRATRRARKVVEKVFYS